MGSKKVINIGNPFKKVESEIQKVRGKKSTTGPQDWQ